MNNKNKKISIRIGDDLYRALTDAAKESGWYVSEEVRRRLERPLPRSKSATRKTSEQTQSFPPRPQQQLQPDEGFTWTTIDD